METSPATISLNLLDSVMWRYGPTAKYDIKSCDYNIYIYILGKIVRHNYFIDNSYKDLISENELKSNMTFTKGSKMAFELQGKNIRWKSEIKTNNCNVSCCNKCSLHHCASNMYSSGKYVLIHASSCCSVDAPIDYQPLNKRMSSMRPMLNHRFSFV